MMTIKLKVLCKGRQDTLLIDKKLWSQLTLVCQYKLHSFHVFLLQRMENITQGSEEGEQNTCPKLFIG